MKSKLLFALFATAATTMISCGQETKPAAPAPAAPAVATPAPEAPAAAAGDAAKIKLGVDATNPMLFDKKEFSVKPGQKVVLLFENAASALPHNICILKPGTKDKIAAESIKLAADPNFVKANYFVDSPDVLFKGTKLVQIGQSDLLQFTAPEAGDYPFICTFPGHAVMMHGVMHVK